MLIAHLNSMHSFWSGQEGVVTILSCGVTGVFDPRSLWTFAQGADNPASHRLRAFSASLSLLCPCPWMGQRRGAPWMQL